MITVKLRWDGIYELMDKANLDEEYSEFERRLKKALECEFDTTISIEWQD
jgi:hypothetical protein